jgi:hypothetical protein
MRTVALAVATVMLASIAFAANTPDELKEIQKVSDAFFKAVVDNDFDAYKAKVAVKRLEEYNANQINCPIANWWESGRKDVDEHSAKWEFVKVKTNMPTNVVIVYKRTMDTGEKEVDCTLSKDGDVWGVYAAGGAF